MVGERRKEEIFGLFYTVVDPKYFGTSKLKTLPKPRMNGKSIYAKMLV